MNNLVLTKAQKVHEVDLKFTVTVQLSNNTYIMSNQLEISGHIHYQNKQTSTKKLEPFKSQNLNEINDKFEEVVANYLTEFQKLNQPIIIDGIEIKIIFEDLLQFDKNVRFLAHGEFLYICDDEWLATLITQPDTSNEFLPPVKLKILTDEIFNLWASETDEYYIPDLSTSDKPVRFSSVEIKLTTNIGTIDAILPLCFSPYLKAHRGNKQSNHTYNHMQNMWFRNPEIWINDKFHTQFNVDFNAAVRNHEIFDVTHLKNQILKYIIHPLNRQIRFPE